MNVTYSDFPGHLKVNWDKLAPSYRRWKSKKGKRVTITANFRYSVEREKKNPAVGRLMKSWTGHERVISQSDSRI